MSSDPEQFIGPPVAPDAEILRDTIRMDVLPESNNDERYLFVAKEIFGEPDKDKAGIMGDWDTVHKIVFKYYIDGTIQKEDQSRLLIKLILEAIYRQDKEKTNLMIEISEDFFGYRNNSDELKMHIAYFLVDSNKFTLEMVRQFVSSIHSWQICDNILLMIINRVGKERVDFIVELAKDIRDPDLKKSTLEILEKY